MDQQTLLVIMTVFVAVSCVALIIQAGFLFGLYKASKGVNDTLTKLHPKIDALMESSKATLDESRTRIVTITDKANLILDATNKQLARVDELMGDATVRTKRQLEHAEMLVDDAMTRAHETVAMVQGGLIKPLREINGVAVGLRAGFQYLMKGVRPSPERLTVDEEMFI